MKALTYVDLAIILMIAFVTAHEILIRKSEGKQPSPRLRYRREDNIRKDLKYIGCEGFILLTIGNTHSCEQGNVHMKVKLALSLTN
jgi:hypothetical protein